MNTRQAFESWFAALYEIAFSRGCPEIINMDDPDSYRDYYDDGDSPEECFLNELSYAA